MWRGMVALIALALLTGPALGGSDQDLTHCTGQSEIDIQAQLLACSQVIARKTVDKTDLAGAYAIRASLLTIDATLKRASLRTIEERRVEAIADFDQAIALRPDFPDYYRERGFEFHMLKDFDRALADYEKGLTLKPDDSDLLFTRALALLEKGEEARAFADLDKVIELTHSPSAYSAKAEVYLKRKETEKALAILDQGIAKNPDHGELFSLYSLRAEVHEERGDNEKALADLAHRIEIEPNQQGGFLHRALLYERLGKLDLAIADYDKLLGFAPNEQVYRDRREALLKTKGVAAAPASSPPPKVTTPVATVPPETRKTASGKRSEQKGECSVFVAAANLTISIPCSK